MPLPPEPLMREALRTRDRSFDGQFFYAVITTGVYCHPSCKARPARPENLRFFETPEAAEKAGFRPCKRCRPQEAETLTARVERVARHIEAHADQRLTLAQLSSLVDMSPGRLQKAFRERLGITPKDYQAAHRLGRLKGALRQGERVIQAQLEAGYTSTSRLHHAAEKSLGMRPTDYQRNGQGEDIRYTARTTSLGLLMIAATARGLCFVQMGDDYETLLEGLAEEFPAACLQESAEASEPHLHAWMAALEAHLDRHTPCPDLPLDIQGTAFQKQVWNFLTTIPKGKTMTYTELAAGVGRPKAVRAAASACAANRLALVIPCHRVLRADGSLGGFRWGLERKRALLEREAAAKEAPLLFPTAEKKPSA